MHPLIDGSFDSLAAEGAFRLFSLFVAFLLIRWLFSQKIDRSAAWAWGLFTLWMPAVGVFLCAFFARTRSHALIRNRKTSLPEPLNVNISEAQSVSFFPDASKTLGALLEEIDRAKDSIALTAYIFSEDDVGRLVLERLCKRSREGVAVFLLLDSIGSRSSPNRFLRQLTDAGGHVSRFMPLLSWKTFFTANFRNHRKLFLFDAERAIVGGQNIDTRFLRSAAEASCQKTPPFTDFSVGLEGPIVQNLLREFITDWTFSASSPPDALLEAIRSKTLASPMASLEPHRIRLLSGGPDGVENPLSQGIGELFLAARQRLTVVTPYYLPSELLRKILEFQSRRGVEVELITPFRSNQHWVDRARERGLESLHRAGGRIYLHKGPVLHAKLLLIDGGQALVGSPNLDRRSLVLNLETALVIEGGSLVRELSSWAEHCKADALPYTPETPPMGRQSPLQRWISDIAVLIEPLL